MMLVDFCYSGLLRMTIRIIKTHFHMHRDSLVSVHIMVLSIAITRISKRKSNQTTRNHCFFGTTKFGLLAGSVLVQSLRSFKFITPVKLILMYAFA